MSKKPFTYNRLIRLAPSFGDWTTLTINDHALDEIQISPVHNINFDSLPRDLLKVAHTIHYRMAEKMVRRLSKDMRIKIELHSIQASQLSYEDFLMLQEEKVVQTDFVLNDLGRVNIIFDWNLADAIVNRLVGGKGERTKKAKFTAIEAAGLQAQMEELVPSFTEQWKDSVTQDDIAYRFSWGTYVQDKTISLREAYVLFSFNLYFGKESLKKMVIAYPVHLLRTLLQRYQSFELPIQQRVALNKQVLSRLKVPVSVALGDTRLSMADVKRLQPGDVLRLNRSLSEPVPIHLGDDTILKGQMGVSEDNHYSLQIIFMDEDAAPVAPIQRESIVEDDTEGEDGEVFSESSEVDDMGELDVLDPELSDESDADTLDDDSDEDVIEADDAEDEDESQDGVLNDFAAPELVLDDEIEEEVSPEAPAEAPTQEDVMGEIEESLDDDDDDFSDIDDGVMPESEPAPIEPAPAVDAQGEAASLQEDEEDDEFSWDDLDV